MESKNLLDIFKKLKEYDDSIKEATSNSKNSIYISSLTPGYREFEKHTIAPFTEYVTDWDDASLDYDSLDGKMSQSRKTIKKIEKRAERISKYIKNNPDKLAQEEGGLLNSSQSKDTDVKPIKNFNPKKTIVKLSEKTKIKNKGLNEDLGVWFGTKKKPKGSSQPKGPWVNICSKKDGKHPPCGRPEGDEKGYPKCRAVGVAAKMTDSQKQSACQQKRKAENKDTQTGKGQKPVMTSYKPKNKKTNESVLISLIRKFLG
jgi:hypothetical protein